MLKIERNQSKSSFELFWYILPVDSLLLAPTTCLGLTSVINLTTSPCSYLSYRTSNPLSISPDTSLISALLSTQWHQMIKKKKNSSTWVPQSSSFTGQTVSSATDHSLTRGGSTTSSSPTQVPLKGVSWALPCLPTTLMAAAAPHPPNNTQMALK